MVYAMRRTLTSRDAAQLRDCRDEPIENPVGTCLFFLLVPFTVHKPIREPALFQPKT